MDFLDPKKKRSHLIRLYVGYALMAVALIIGTILLWYFSFGFNIDPKTKTVIQNGLLFLDAHPESAKVVINGKDKGTTDTRLVMPAGSYSIELQRQGYRTWKHDVAIEGGVIERFIYPFLFPEKLVSKDAQLFAAAPTLASQSPDRHWLVIQQPGNINNFSTYDLTKDNTEPSLISLPTSVLTQTGTKHVITPIEWSTDNRHLILKHVYDGGQEFILIDREIPTEAVNLSSHFSRVISDMRLRDKKYDHYYLHDKTSGELSAAVLQSKQVTPVAQRVVSFQPHGSDKVLYATEQNAPTGKTLVKIKDGDKTYILREVGQSPKYLLDIAQFDGKWYLAAGASTEQKVFVYIDPFGELKDNDARLPVPSVLLRLNSPVEYLSFSSNTRCIAIQGGSSFAVYDAENKRQFRYETKLKLPADYKATWMDGHRLTAVSEGKLNIWDFDGTNQQTIISSDPAFTPFFDRDYKQLFTISPSSTVKNKTALVNSDLLIKPTN